MKEVLVRATQFSFTWSLPFSWFRWWRALVSSPVVAVSVALNSFDQRQLWHWCFQVSTSPSAVHQSTNKSNKGQIPSIGLCHCLTAFYRSECVVSLFFIHTLLVWIVNVPGHRPLDRWCISSDWALSFIVTDLVILFRGILHLGTKRSKVCVFDFVGCSE